MAGEKQIENEIKKYLKSKKIYHVKIHGSTFQQVGIPDILACVKGTFVGIEVKDIGKEYNTSEAQKVHIENIISSGGRAVVVSSVEQVKRLVEQIERDTIK